MPETGEARSWWADVEHVREAIERRREAEQRASAARAERHLSVVGDPRDRRGSGAHGTARHTTDRNGLDRQTTDRRAGDRRVADRHTGDRRINERRSGDRRAPGPRTAELRVIERRVGERRGGHQADQRRTVQITGRTVPAPAVPRSGDPTIPYGARGSSRRPSLSPTDRLVHRPDRIAMWAVVLGFILILVAATSA
jgi:hypothetical protein